MITKLPVYQAKLTDFDNDGLGIFAMSLVNNPANESNFVALSTAARRPVKLSLDKTKQIVTGAVLVPDQMIYRNDTNGEYYLTFTAQDIEKIRDRMMKGGVALATTTHEHEAPLRGNNLVECWIVEDPARDKSVALGLGPYKKGTLVASYKIGDAAYWRTQVLAGKVRGFSIEGLFNFKSVTMSKPQAKAATILPNKKPTLAVGLSGVLRSIAAALDGDTAGDTKDLAGVAKADETDSGTPYIIFELQDGTEIDVDKDGNCTMADGTQAPAGDHTLQDGNTISIADDGTLVGTTDAAEATPPAAAPAALTAEQTAARDAAKAKGKLAAAALAAAAKPLTGDAKKIAELKAQIATLEKTPTAPKAAPAVEGGSTNITGAVVAKMKGHERAAVLLKEKLARNAK